MISVKTKLLSPLLLFLYTCHFYYYILIIKFYALCEKEKIRVEKYWGLFCPLLS